jgi:hypothetical protein
MIQDDQANRPKAQTFQFVLTDWMGPPVPVVAYEPAGWTPDAPVIFALHGVNRNVDFTLRTWEALADRHRFLLIVPNFDERNFPGSRGYNLGDVVNGRPPPGSSYNAIGPIFAEAKARSGSVRAGYRLFGHSAGAQFVHRFLWLHPEAPVEKAVISMAGWYTLPDQDPWPYGLGGLGTAMEDLAKPLRTEVMVQVGELDSDPHAENLRRTAQARQQGSNRLDRGKYFYQRARQAAHDANLPFGWILRVANDTGHQSDLAAIDAAPWLVSED